MGSVLRLPETAIEFIVSVVVLFALISFILVGIYQIYKHFTDSRVRQKQKLIKSLKSHIKKQYSDLDKAFGDLQISLNEQLNAQLDKQIDKITQESVVPQSVIDAANTKKAP